MVQQLERRSVLVGAAAFGLAGAARPQEALAPTPQIEMGPFYPVIRPADVDADLTQIAGRTDRAKGQVIQLIGRLVDLQGRPIPSASLDVWQCNADGRYDHSADENVAAALDPGFQGFARIAADAAGEFRITTIKPAAYPAGPGWMRAPHIHMDATGRSSRRSLQMMFPNEPLLSQDRVLENLDADELRRTTANVIDTAADGTPRYGWTIVMLEG